MRYALVVAALAASVAALVSLRPWLNQTTIALVLVLIVLGTAVWFGKGPALLVAVLSGLAFNFFFLLPYHTFSIREPQDIVAFATFIITALLVGPLVTQLRERTFQNEQQQRRLEMQSAEAEVLRRSEQLKGALLDAVTHDLRTPLTSIKAAASTLRGSVTADARTELCEVIEQETDRLDHFVNGMVDFARMQAGDLTLHSRDVSADEIVENALLRAENILAAHEVTTNVPDDLFVRADPRLVSQVLFTLLENASRYSPPGTRISVGAGPTNESVCFSVRDEGSGVPPEIRSRIFEHFFRGDDRGGSGMGLAIARRIVQAHGGSIWVADADSGRGADFRFRVPRGSAA